MSVRIRFFMACIIVHIKGQIAQLKQKITRQIKLFQRNYFVRILIFIIFAITVIEIDNSILSHCYKSKLNHN